MLAEVPDYPIQMYRQPAAMSPEERDREVRALLARAALRLVLTRRTENGGMALTGSRVRAMNVPPRSIGVNA